MYERGVVSGGFLLDATGREEVINPATGQVVGTFASASAASVDRAVLMMQAAQPEWARTPVGDRASIMLRSADLIEEHAQLVAIQLTLEQGKPLPDSLKEVLFAAQVFRYYADQEQLLEDQHRRSGNSQYRSLVRRPPLGVVAGIVPWNYPVDLWAWKVAPALMAGNAILVKPPIETPLAAGMVAELLYEAGLPDGILCDMPGGIEVGRAITTHPGIRGISATCSTAAGTAIMRDAAASMKRLTLELGGNCPFIVLDDADVAAAAKAAARRSFSNSGQICIAVNRIIVMESVAEEFADLLAAEVEAIVIGDGMHQYVTMGPTTTDAVRVKTQLHVSDALARGALQISSKDLPPQLEESAGFFMAPTVLDWVPADALIAREETFGPAVGIMRVRTESDALRLANDSPYGLAAYVYTEDEDRGHGFARQLEFGGVGINVNDVTELDAPFGGWKMSGFGRDLGPEGLIGMTESQHIRALVTLQ